MFCLPRHTLFRETLEEEMAALPDALTPYFERDRREDGYRPGKGPRFVHLMRNPTPEEVEIRRRVCLFALDSEDWDVINEANAELTAMEKGHIFPLEIVTCPICRCDHSVREECFSSYGGTTEGYTSCGFCGYTWSWADISAVI